MAIPISYNIRNLIVRKTSTIMTALGIALTVAVLLAVLALVEGLRTAFKATSNPAHILVTRKGATSELVSSVSRTTFQDMKAKPGIARTKSGEPMASLEMVTVIALPTPDNPSGVNINVRGVTPIGIEIRDGVKIDSGRWFTPGRREVVVGKNLVKRFPDTQLGSKMQFGKGDWEVVGIMSQGTSAVNSELWVDLNQGASDYNRSEMLSSVLIRAVDVAAVQSLINELKADQRLNVSAITEQKYYDDQMVSAAPMQFLGMFVAVIMAVGSCFAAMNTMYASVSRRAREVGTLRVLGFSRGGILTSFFLESLLLSAIGGLIGCILVLPLNNIQTSLGNFITFSETSFSFRVTPLIMLMGVTFAVILGAIGGIFPARMAAKKEILNALREI
ncbi:MAG TPA: ABC transporter permease [Bryobacteraceae bacterium]|nr:ABC transporter permease [Bryobacteraceae bacterium]